MNLFKKKSNTRQDESYFCPYCPSVFPSTRTMSRHVDNKHTGKADARLPEEDLSNW